MNAIVSPMISETPRKEESETFSPNTYPRYMIPVAQIVDATRKIPSVRRVGVRAIPATIGMNAFIDGVSFPKNIHHIPRREKVSERAP